MAAPDPHSVDGMRADGLMYQSAVDIIDIDAEKDDDDALSVTIRGIRATTLGGNIKIKTLNGTTRTFKLVLDQLEPVFATQVFSTDTVATGIIGYE